MTNKKKKAVCVLGMMVFLGAALIVFTLAMDEQSMMASGSPMPEVIRLQDFVSRGEEKNKRIGLTHFYFGKQYVYAAKLVQFRDVYLPVFANGQAEDGRNLQVLIWIQNSRNSNQRFIESPQDLDQFVAAFNANPRMITGMLRQPTSQVRSLTAEAYPGTNVAALQVLWARNYPEQDTINILWGLSGFCLLAAVACFVAYRIVSRAPASS